MIVNAPAPKLPAAPAPAAPAPAAGAPVPTGAAPTPTAPPAGNQAAAGAKPGEKAPAGQAGPADAAAAKAQVIEQLEKTTAVDAIAQVASHLDKVATLSVGGGTPAGTEGAKAASALLTDASMLLQHAHVKAMEQLRTMATELHMRLMSSASGLAYMGGQVAIAGQSKEPVKLSDIAAGPIKETKETMADVIDVLIPKEKAGEKPAGDAPAATPAGPDAKPTTPEQPGNTGVAGPLGDPPPVDPTKVPPTAPAAS